MMWRAGIGPAGLEFDTPALAQLASMTLATTRSYGQMYILNALEVTLDKNANHKCKHHSTCANR